MGQQQLLLLVLGIVIVGIAVVAGIQAFSEGKVKAEQDAAVTDAMRIISDTQAWKLKPGAFGGGAGLTTPEDFSTVNLKALGYPVASGTGVYTTTNGCFSLGGAVTGATLTLYQGDGSTPAVDENKKQTAETCAGAEIATVTIDGTTSADIAWAYSTGD